MTGAWLRIVHVNDVYELRNLPKLATLVKHATGARGAVRSSTNRVFEAVSQPRPDATLCVLSGDFLSPSTLSSLDRGHAMIDVLNAVPVSHVCFGNHEADVGLKDLKRRMKSFAGVWLNSNMPDFPSKSAVPFDIVHVGAHRIGMLGLLACGDNIFKDGTFRGVRICEVAPTAHKWTQRLLLEHGCRAVVPITHQPHARDVELAALSPRFPCILGGHEHDLLVEDYNGCKIFKSGSDATHAILIDMLLDDEQVLCDSEVVVLDDLEADEHVQALVDGHMDIVNHMHEELILDIGTPISSEGVRRQQTTVGALLCSAIRSELQVDAALLNGGPIKANRCYPSGAMSYAQLREELPFPTKMVSLGIPGSVLSEAVCYSRLTSSEPRGFLQVDDRIDTREDGIERIGGARLDGSHEYMVALPRNLLNGFCSNKPLIEFAKANAHRLPAEYSFVPAIDIVLRHFSRDMWRRLGSFDQLDENSDGQISSEEVEAAFRSRFGRPPSTQLLGAMFEALYADGDGRIQAEEFEVLNA